MNKAFLLTWIIFTSAGASLALSGCGAGEATAEQGHEEEGGHAEGEVAKLTNAQLLEYGVEILPLTGGLITTHLTLPAEVGLNQDALLHVTPRAPGIAIEVNAFLGDDVVPGQVMAVLDSPALGEAKISLLQTLQAFTTAQSDLDRQRTISANTERLLEILRVKPTLESLQKDTAELRIGENKGRLLSTYARVQSSRANYAREKELREKGLSTQADFLAAQEMYNSSLAEYMAVFEDVNFTYQIRFQEAERAERVAGSAVENAKRRLHILGLSDPQITGVSDESPADIARYEVKAPMGGRVVAKHITPGEKVDSVESIYTIAQLDTVWLNIAVYARYLGQIREGQSVVVHADGRDATGLVTYVSATLSESTRTVTARVVLDNDDRAWRPGEFLTVRIETGETSVVRRVPIEAVQVWDGKDVVFIQDDDGIEPWPIQTGVSSDTFIEILNDDLPLGTPIVMKNSFLIKAELGKSSAGHEH